MLKNKKLETYYVVSSRYDLNQRKIITIISETDGQHVFEFIASFEKIIDLDLLSLFKKVKGYSFDVKELATLRADLANEMNKSIKSILTENNMESSHIDCIAIENPELNSDISLDLATHIQQQLNIPVIFNINLNNNTEFLKVLAENKQIDSGFIINLDENFDIYKLNSKTSYIESSLGYSILRYLAMYFNLEQDNVAYLISQGEVDEGIINKLKTVETLEILQKDLINSIMFSKIKTEDKLKTAFFVIKSLLLQNLAEFDKNSNIMLIGNTGMIEELNQALKGVFNNVVFLKNQSQRQHTLLNEQLAFTAAKKHVLENYNNGVKLS
ncbi:MAG TPA: hypothetical protein DCL21_01265 [Alphaproteobacteria bacterium]|nr:hypothetical protein [Alphaproteobacteria bacterium]